jgi:hypothetical protein
MRNWEAQKSAQLIEKKGESLGSGGRSMVSSGDMTIETAERVAPSLELRRGGEA